MKQKQRYIAAAFAALATLTAARAAVSITPGYENPGPDGTPFLYDSKGTFSDNTYAAWNVTASVGGWSFADLRGNHNFFGTPIGTDQGWGHTSAWYLVEIQQATQFTLSMTTVSIDARPGFVIYAGESVNDDPNEAHQYSNNGVNMALNAGWDFNGPGGTQGLTFVANGINPTGSNLTGSVFLNPGLYTIAVGNVGDSTLATGAKSFDVTMAVPEPSSLIVGMTGGLLAFMRRRR
jgi:hypothetical protein